MMAPPVLQEERLESARRAILVAIEMRVVRPRLVLYPAALGDTLCRAFNELGGAKSDCRWGDKAGATATERRVRRRLERISPRVPLGVAEHLNRAAGELR